jgi:hypothetical protein
MSGYLLTNQQAGSFQALAATYKSQVRAVAAAASPRRLRYLEFEFSSISVPNSTDCQVLVDITYCGATGAGTGTAATPQPTDSGAAIGTQIDTATSTGVVNFSAEPTTFVAANNFYLRAFNQRSGVLWQTEPGRELIQPSTISTGSALRAQSTNYAGFVATKLLYDEL